MYGGTSRRSGRVLGGRVNSVTMGRCMYSRGVYGGIPRRSGRVLGSRVNTVMM